LVLLIVGVIVGVKSLGSGKIASSLASVGVPGIAAATPQSIIGEFVEIAGDLQKTLDSVTDEPSRDAAVVALQAISKRLQKLHRRIAQAEPISEQELQTIAEQYKDRMDVKSFETSARRLATSNVLNEQLTAALMESGYTLGSVTRVMKAGLEVLPEPNGDLETLSRDAAQLKRDSARVLSRVESVSDIPTATSELRTLETKFDELAQRRRELPPSTVITSRAKYLSYSSAADGLMVSLQALITSELGAQPALHDAGVAAMTAASRLEFAMAGVGPDSRPSGSAATEPGGLPGGPGFGPGFPGFQPGQPGFRPGQPGLPFGQPGTPAGGGSP
jgi:hypothetical protein